MDTESGNAMKKLWIKFVNWVKYLFRRPNKALQKGVSLCLLCLGKIKISHISLPENFDLERHKAQYPPQEYGFQHIAFRDFKALYILNLLADIPARNSDLIREDGFVPIHTPTLRNHVKDCKYYVDYLVNTGVLVCDGQHIIGEKSRWYRWADPYIGMTSVNSELIRRLMNMQKRYAGLKCRTIRINRGTGTGIRTAPRIPARNIWLPCGIST